MQDALKGREEIPTGVQPFSDDSRAGKQTELEAVEVIALAITVLLALAGLAPVLLVVLFI